MPGGRLRNTTRVAAFLAVAACHATGRGRAEEPGLDVSARGGIYLDDDATSVVTTVAGIEGKALEHASVRVHGLLDIVSSASVDVVSAATERWDETRKEFGASLGYEDGTRTLSASYRRSVENDWGSHTGSLGGSHDFMAHNLTLGLGVSATHNDVGRADDENFAEQLRSYGGTLSATVVASRNDILSLTYAPSHLVGYQSSPYRFVRYLDPTAGAVVSGPEVVPERRWRHAVVVAHNHHLLEDSALRSHGRAYWDDWGIASGTLGTEYVHGLGGFEPSVFVRGYYQGRAGFYEDGYSTRRRYMTADRELGVFWDVFAGIRLAYRKSPLGFLKELRSDLKLTGFLFAFEEFERLPERRGFTAELGLGGALGGDTRSRSVRSRSPPAAWRISTGARRRRTWTRRTSTAVCNRSSRRAARRFCATAIRSATFACTRATGCASAARRPPATASSTGPSATSTSPPPSAS